ncbi:MAG: NADH-quinone oxidoreductase subunit J [Gammaproteobacteria bacterium]
MVTQLIFYFFSALLVFSAIMVISVRNPVRAALFLVLAFFASAGIWLLLEAEFLAIALVLVYVGAVMVLFLFVVMMLDINLAPLKEGFARYLPVGAGVAVLMLIAMALAVGPSHFGLERIAAPDRHGAGYSNTRELGRVLYTDYVYPFEIASVILLVAIIAAIALTMRPKRQTKAQKPEQQIRVRRADRVRLVGMKAETMRKDSQD